MYAKYIVKLYGMPQILKVLEKNMGKTLSEIVTISDGAHTLSLVENSKEVW